MPPLVIPFAFASAGVNTPTSQLDADYQAIATWINSRNPTAGVLASRPAPGNEGALYVATDQGNLLYIDTGAVWIPIGVLGPSGALGYFKYVEIATPPTPVAAGYGYVKSSAMIERPWWLDSGGQEYPLVGVLGRAAPPNLSNSAVETTLLSQVIKANTLNGVALGLRLSLGTFLLNNSGSNNGVTFRIKLDAFTVGTVGSGNIATSGTAHGVRLDSQFDLIAGGGTPPWSVFTILRVFGGGIVGGASGIQVNDASAGSGGAIGALNTTVDHTLVVTAQMSAAHAQLQLIDSVLRVEYC